MEDIAFTLHWNKEAAVSFRPLLIEADVKFNERSLLLKSGPMAAAAPTAVEILSAVSGLGIAGVLVAWINAKANRHIHITKVGNTVEVIARGMGAKDVCKILEQVKDVSITEIPEEP